MEIVGHGLCNTLVDIGNGMRGGWLPSLLLNLYWECNQNDRGILESEKDLIEFSL